MGTEILLPQDWLIQQSRVFPAAFYRRKCSYGNINNNFNSSSYRSNRKPTGRSERLDQRKRVVSNFSEPSSLKRSSSDDGPLVDGLVMEKVMILRRGKSLDSTISREKSKKVVDSEAVKCDMYAGSAFYMSPAPSLLPLPSFYKKKQVSVKVEDSATRDLRRLLRLDV